MRIVELAMPGNLPAWQLDVLPAPCDDSSGDGLLNHLCEVLSPTFALWRLHFLRLRLRSHLPEEYWSYSSCVTDWGEFSRRAAAAIVRDRLRLSAAGEIADCSGVSLFLTQRLCNVL